jgi:hypothetical protein
MEDKPKEFLEAIQKARELAGELQDDFNRDVVLRRNALESIEELKRSVQGPQDHMWDVFGQPFRLPAIHSALDAGWLEAVASSHSNGMNESKEHGITADAIAQQTKSDVRLIRRIFRLVTAAGIVEEVGQNTYAPNHLTHFWITPGARGGAGHFSNNCDPAMNQIPTFLANNGYRNPDSSVYTPFSYVFGKGLFKVLEEQPARAKDFNNMMGRPVEERSAELVGCLSLAGEIEGGK